MVIKELQTEYIERLKDCFVEINEETLAFLSCMETQHINVDTDEPQNIERNIEYIARLTVTLLRVVGFYISNDYTCFNEDNQLTNTSLPDELRLSAKQIFATLCKRTQVLQYNVFKYTQCHVAVIDKLVEAIRNKQEDVFVDLILQYNVNLDDISKRLNVTDTLDFNHIEDAQLYYEDCVETIKMIGAKENSMKEEVMDVLIDECKPSLTEFCKQEDPQRTWMLNTSYSKEAIGNGSLLQVMQDRICEINALLLDENANAIDKHNALLSLWAMGVKQLITKLDSMSQQEKELLIPLLSTYYYRPIYDRLLEEWHDVSIQSEQPLDSFLRPSLGCNINVEIKVDKITPMRLSKSPDIKEVIILKIANRLAGTPNPANDANFSVKRIYLLQKDVSYFTFFLTGTIMDGKTPDETYIIDWQGSWQSLKYVLFKLYSNGSLPDGTSEAVARHFTFMGKSVKPKTYGGSNLLRVQGDMLKRYRQELEILDEVLTATPNK